LQRRERPPHAPFAANWAIQQREVEREQFLQRFFGRDVFRPVISGGGAPH
jgi:hypothetical protein